MVCAATSEIIGFPQRWHCGPEIGSMDARQAEQSGIRLPESRIPPQARHGAGKKIEATAPPISRKRARAEWSKADTACRAYSPRISNERGKILRVQRPG